MNAVRTAIFARLHGDSTLTGLLSDPDAVFHQVAPADASTPFVVFNKQAGAPSRMFGASRIDADVWQIKAVGSGGSASAAEAIAARIDSLFDLVALSVSGRRLVICRRQTDVDYLEQDATHTYHHVGALYEIETQP